MQLRAGAKTPQHKTGRSAGLDLTPADDGRIESGETKKISTGIRVQIPKDHFGLLLGRSSVALKGQISIPVGAIDSDYRDEVQIMAHNNMPYPINYRKNGKALAQMIMIPYEDVEPSEWTQEKEPLQREGGFGSTDKPQVNLINSGRVEIPGKINGKSATFLIDSGADISVIGENHVKEKKLDTERLRPPLTAFTADGAMLDVKKTIKGARCEIQGFGHTHPVHVLPGETTGVILGNDWLKKWNPDIDWEPKR
jgi:dUTP pyrophosphatase